MKAPRKETGKGRKLAPRPTKKRQKGKAPRKSGNRYRFGRHKPPKA